MHDNNVTFTYFGTCQQKKIRAQISPQRWKRKTPIFFSKLASQACYFSNEGSSQKTLTKLRFDEVKTYVDIVWQVVFCINGFLLFNIVLYPSSYMFYVSMWDNFGASSHSVVSMVVLFVAFSLWSCIYVIGVYTELNALSQSPLCVVKSGPCNLICRLAWSQKTCWSLTWRSCHQISAHPSVLLNESFLYQVHFFLQKKRFVCSCIFLLV